MTEKRLIEGLSFDEYLRRNSMPTKTLDDSNYRIVEKVSYDDKETIY